MSSFRCVPADLAEHVVETSLSGEALCQSPALNRGTAFTAEERDLFDLHGRLPVAVETLDEQVARHYACYQMLPSDEARNVYLHRLAQDNEVLFYRLLADHLTSMTPMIYTPTVGWAVEQYSRLFKQPEGLYLCYADRAHMRAHVQAQLAGRAIKACVITDGGAVLGIGDQGVGGMAIAVGKKMVYTACGGMNPHHVLPVVLDMGTDNQKLLDDPHYLGWRHARIQGEAYDAYMAQLMDVLQELAPNMYVHWEDVAREQAVALLDRYQDRICTFNDDIQGTGAVTMACLLSAIARTGGDLKQQRIVIHGAGAAALGIAGHIVQAMQLEGMTEAEACDCFYLLNSRGLLTDAMDGLNPHQQRFVRPESEWGAWPNPQQLDLQQVVEAVKPTILIGCSTQSGAFTESVVRTMVQGVDQPIILPLSNPSAKSEIVPDDALRWSEGRALVATGSPFPEVTHAGQHYVIAQCNNALIYPGIGLGVLVSSAQRMTFAMLHAASKALAAQVSQTGVGGALLPALSQYPDVSLVIAKAVAAQARQEGVAGVADDVDLNDRAEKMFWRPYYRSLRKC